MISIGHSPSQLAQATLQNEQFSMYPATQNATIPSAGETPSYTSLGVIEDMLDGPAQLDWVSSPAAAPVPEANWNLIALVRQPHLRGRDGYKSQCLVFGKPCNPLRFYRVQSYEASNGALDTATIMKDHEHNWDAVCSVSYTNLTLQTKWIECISRWSPYK